MVHTTSRRFLTVKVPQAAELLGINKTTLWKAIRTGEVPHVRVGRSVRVQGWWLEEQLGQPLEEILGEEVEG